MARSSPDPARQVLYGALAVGCLDAIDAIVFFGLRGATPLRIFQSIASGVLGRDAFAGGVAAAALGVLCHFTIAFGIVLVYFLASRRIPLLARRPVTAGMAYGVIVYGIMNLVVVPLSRVHSAPLTLAVFTNGILIHALGIGPTAAFFVRRARSTPGAT